MKTSEESICQGCEGDGFCGIQDDKNDTQYNCLIDSKWASVQSRLEAVKKLLPELTEILNMDWIWLSKKPLDRLLKWDEALRAALEGETSV